MSMNMENLKKHPCIPLAEEHAEMAKFYLQQLEKGIIDRRKFWEVFHFSLVCWMMCAEPAEDDKLWDILDQNVLAPARLKDVYDEYWLEDGDITKLVSDFLDVADLKGWDLTDPDCPATRALHQYVRVAKNQGITLCMDYSSDRMMQFTYANWDQQDQISHFLRGLLLHVDPLGRPVSPMTEQYRGMWAEKEAGK